MNSKLCNLRGYLVALFLSISLGMLAQIEVTGTVLETTGDPVIGAVVKEKGNEAAATTTDFDGHFTLKVKSDKATLIVSCVGMQTKEVALNGRKDVEVVMGEDSQVLDEFVVVGYGTSRKVDITGSVASVNEETLRQGVAANADQMLSGKIPGVQVTANSGAPGAATSIRIRGASSVSDTHL
ncbi:MAG: carboxypeptidase-like regulatory domain-containing protein, partial [Muribaculaceae bacterium]|nr:carboxypeptidase-like regulatory domain-containing protein [Muribaculaceae bacterium]